MHVEHLDWLAKNPRYTQRFAMHVGKLCREMPNKTVAEMERLHHSTVKDLDKRGVPGKSDSGISGFLA